jgi:thymidine kinase
LNVIEIISPKEKYHDVRKIVLDELNDYNRKTCEILAKVIDSNLKVSGDDK